MKIHYSLFDSSSKSFSRKPTNIMSVFILFAIIVFFIFNLGKDSANYDKQHSVSVNKMR